MKMKDEIAPTADVLDFSKRVTLGEPATAENVSAIGKAEGFFAERKGRGDKGAAIRLLTRSGGAPPRAGDELPD